MHGNAFDANTTRERGQRAASSRAYSRARARSACSATTSTGVPNSAASASARHPPMRSIPSPATRCRAGTGTAGVHGEYVQPCPATVRLQCARPFVARRLLRGPRSRSMPGFAPPGRRIRSTPSPPTSSAGGRDPAPRPRRQRALALRVDRAERAGEEGCGFAPGDAIAREAIVVCWNRDGGAAYRAVVSLPTTASLSWEDLPGDPAQPHARRVARVRRGAAPRAAPDRGARQARDHGHGPGPDRRLGLPRLPRARALRRPPRRLDGHLVPVAGGSNPYANPVNGLHCVVDLNTMELLEIEDTFAVDKPPTMGEYVPRFVPDLRLRDDLKPVEITQPDGVSFTLDGHALRWQNWSLRLGFNHREGLVLHTLGFAGGRCGRRAPHLAGRDGRPLPRPVARPLPPHRLRHRRVGPRLHDQVARARLRLPGRDPLRRRRPARHGAASRTRSSNAICIHEEDDGVLWKHVDPSRGRRGPPLAPARDLRPRHRRQLRVPRLLAALPGRLDRVPRARDRDHGRRAPPRGRAPPLRHDGRPAHLRAVPPALPDRAAGHGRRRPGQHRAHGRVRGAADRPGRPVRARAHAARHAAAHRGRGLPGLQVGDPARLEGRQRRPSPTTSARRSPTSSCPGAALPAHAARTRRCCGPPRRCATRSGSRPTTPDERWPCGEFPTSPQPTTGLPGWTAADRSIEDTDVVLWYVFGIHHITRMEDWPIMPVDTVSFWLKPFGFFDRNPTLDVPPTRRTATTRRADETSRSATSSTASAAPQRTGGRPT